jgi:hypothetical protein
MQRPLFSGAALVCLVALPAVLPAAETLQAKKPTVVVRLQPIDELLANFRYLAGLVGQEEQARQIEGFLKSMAGPKGIEGIDTKRPLGVYSTVGAQVIDSTIVALVPVADEQALLDLLRRFEIKAEKGADGLYTVRHTNLPVPVYFRFANRYAYVTAQDESAIAKEKLLPPEQVLPPNPTAVLALNLNISSIPEAFREEAIKEFQKRLEEEKKKREPNETDIQHKFKEQFVDIIGAQMISLIRDGDAATLSLNIDRKGGELSLDYTLTGKPGSKLAGLIADLTKARSVVAGLVGKNSVFSLTAYAAMSEDLRQALAPVIDEAIREGLKEEKDKAKRELGEKLAKVLVPTLKAAELDLAADLRGPSAKGVYTAVAGIKVKDGAAMDQVMRDLVKEMPAEERAQVKLDVEQAGPVKIHRVDVHKHKDFDAEARKAFGDNPLYFAFRADAVFLALGENGLSALKEALAAPPKPVQPLRLDVSLAPLAQAATEKNVSQAAQEAFGKGKDNDKVLLLVEGGPALKLRVSVKAPVIQFLSKVAQSRADKEK